MYRWLRSRNFIETVKARELHVVQDTHELEIRGASVLPQWWNGRASDENCGVETQPTTLASVFER